MTARLAPLALGWGIACAMIAACSNEPAPTADTVTPATPAAPAATAAPARPTPASPEAADGTLTIDIDAIQKPWTGDLDGMIERRHIRVLTVK